MEATEQAKTAVYRMQNDLARAGMYSASWYDGEMWHLIASTNPQTVDKEMHEQAGPTDIITWVAGTTVFTMHDE